MPDTFLHRLHRDERGVISVLSVFALFLFTILLVLIVNTGRQIDDKIRMQNAADAAAYSGGVAVARGLNAIALSNHLLCESFAITAYLREGRDRHADPFVPPILQAWQTVGSRFASGGSHPKWRNLGEEILEKIPIEQQLADAFSEMAYHQAREVLPHFEYILCGPDYADPPSVAGNRSPQGGFLPRFARAVVQTTPAIVQVATDEIARRYGVRSAALHDNQPLYGVLWRSSVEPIGVADESDFRTRTLPAVDPSPFSDDGAAVYGDPQFDCFYCLARAERQRLARGYLQQWIDEWQSPFFELPVTRVNPHRGAETAKMSNYIGLFRIFACGQLDSLLNVEYPDTNLPHLLREVQRVNCERIPGPNCWADRGGPCMGDAIDLQQQLQRDYVFIGAAYWPPLSTMFSGLFQNPFARDPQAYAVTFAQAHVYIPRARFDFCHTLSGRTVCGWSRPYLCYDSNGIPGTCWQDFYDPWPREWDLFNQNWTVKLTPATADQLTPILATHPGGTVQTYRAPALGNVSDSDLRAVNFH